jgi:hypothetical protein
MKASFASTLLGTLRGILSKAKGKHDNAALKDAFN